MGQVISGFEPTAYPKTNSLSGSRGGKPPGIKPVVKNCASSGARKLPPDSVSASPCRRSRTDRLLMQLESSPPAATAQQPAETLAAGINGTQSPCRKAVNVSPGFPPHIQLWFELFCAVWSCLLRANLTCWTERTPPLRSPPPDPNSKVSDNLILKAEFNSVGYIELQLGTKVPLIVFDGGILKVKYKNKYQTQTQLIDDG